ncbi:putative metal-binding protein [Dysgonomonas hofstadii]|uniref:Putative metal-binding protein n=1 Tax=Dysgonomonas hofstadii TaxID=637886 RepID=A0A840CNF5_9BACT|nr:DUF2284 domain-containing protein [Dysgonomonas hofstadii]MBB4035598.1 putative metal-binding protein [Dysgonomonas hofstadii]
MLSVKNYFSYIPIVDYIADYRDVDKFIVFCKQCSKYGNCWACPPYEFDTTDYILKYNRAYIIGTKINLSYDIRKASKDAEESKLTGANIITDVRKVLDEQLLKIEADIPNSKAFFAGTCHICEPEGCMRIQNEPCRYPDKIRHSLESIGFDIGKTTEELLNIKLKWSNDGFLPEYLTLVSGLFTNSRVDNLEDYFT